MSASDLPPPKRVISQNIFSASSTHNEPVVHNKIETMDVPEIPGFGGSMRRKIIGNFACPVSNDAPHDDGANPGSGIVHPGGTTIYYLDLAPHATTPMHRTVSSDVMIVLNGQPTLVTPKGEFSLVDGKATYKETEQTIIQPGSTVVQRGEYHAWENHTDEWVRFVAVVMDAKAQVVEVGGEKVTLGEVWL